MLYPKDRNIHRPPHLFLDNAKYFIASRTINWLPIFEKDYKKKILYNCILEALNKYKYICDSWVILNNHYQLVLDIQENSKDIFLFIKQINGSSSREINKLDNKMGRNVWDQYWDTILDSDKNYWTHMNYNHHNPVKHGYVTKIEDYEWSDFSEHMKIYGRDAVYERFEMYPIIDFTPPWEAQ